MLALVLASLLHAEPSPPPSTPPAPPKLAGGLTADEIGRVIRRHSPEVKACYDEALTKTKGLAGTVELAFEIGPSGAVATSEVAENTTGDAGLGACISREARRWMFPIPRGGGSVKVNYPFLLKPVDAPRPVIPGRTSEPGKP